MRKFLISLLAASMLVPAAAQAEDGGFLRGMRNQAERSSQRDDNSYNRSSRAERRSEQSNSEHPARVERAPPEDRTSRVERVRRVDHGDRRVQRIERGERSIAVTEYNGGHSEGSHRDAHRDSRRDHREFHATDPSRREHRDYHREVDRDHRADHRSWNRDRGRGSHGDYHRDVRREHNELHAGDPTGREHRDWHRKVERQHDRRHAQWSTDWRRDTRYNWYDYRSRYSSLYNLGRYYDPYGWGYRRFSIGFSLWPSYYGSSFWLDDPWRYRLPPAYGPYRWIRYYDDALLVNIYTGQVVDVIHNVFW